MAFIGTGLQRPYAPSSKARATDELRRLLAVMVGEYKLVALRRVGRRRRFRKIRPRGNARGVVGNNRLSFDRRCIRTIRKLRITEVLPNSPARLHDPEGRGTARRGWTRTGPHVSLDELVEHKVGQARVLDIGGREVRLRTAGTALAPSNLPQVGEDNRAVRHSAERRPDGLCQIRGHVGAGCDSSSISISIRKTAQGRRSSRRRNNNAASVERLRAGCSGRAAANDSWTIAERRTDAARKMWEALARVHNRAVW